MACAGQSLDALILLRKLEAPAKDSRSRNILRPSFPRSGLGMPSATLCAPSVGQPRPGTRSVLDGFPTEDRGNEEFFHSTASPLLQ